jgi:hypothetical protein
VAEQEAEARAVNAQPWEPPPGMVKRRCLRCRYLFAVKVEEAETTATCPDCAPAQRFPAGAGHAAPPGAA